MLSPYASPVWINSAEEKQQLTQMLLTSPLHPTWVEDMVTRWGLRKSEECLQLMSELKPWEEWYGSPWELVFQQMFISTSGAPSRISLPYDMFPKEMYRRAINRMPHMHLDMFVDNEIARPIMLEWLVKNWSAPKYLSQGNILFSFMNNANSSEIETLWNIVIVPSNNPGDIALGWLGHIFFGSQYMPYKLVEDFLTNPPDESFSWENLASLCKNKRFSSLVESFGGAEVLAAKVNSDYGSWEAALCFELPNRVRAKAALVKYGWNRIMKIEKIDLIHEIVLLLREEAEQAGLDSALPADMLAEILWEKTSPGYKYLTEARDTGKSR